MYEKFYGFHTKPFQLNPDPEFYFASTQHRRAKAYLDYGVMRNEGFVVITGDIGAGKTTVVRGLLESLESGSVVAAQLVSTQLEADDLLRAIGAAFGVRVKNVQKSELLMALEVFLVSQAGLGKRCLLIVDEAQNLTLTALEELRMLSNFQFGKHSLLQSFLIGQPEFREQLDHPNLLQLRQRIIAACHIGPLESSEIKAYVEHRIQCASDAHSINIDHELYPRLFEMSGGIPRNINFVMDRLLLQGFLKGENDFRIDDLDALQADFVDESGPFRSLFVSRFPKSTENCGARSGHFTFDSGVREATSPGVVHNIDLLTERNARLDGLVGLLSDRLDAVEQTNAKLLSALDRLNENMHSRSFAGKS